MSSSFIPAFVFLLVSLVSGRPDGAPEVACEDMTPRHGANLPQPPDSAAPFALDASSLPGSGDRVLLTLRPTAPDVHIKGFFLQARDDGNRLVGSFDVNPSVGRFVACDRDSPDAAITHVSDVDKDSVNVTWNAPPKGVSSSSSVTFRLTVVEFFHLFWTGIELKHQMVVSPATSSTPPPTPATTSATPAVAATGAETAHATPTVSGNTTHPTVSGNTSAPGNSAAGGGGNSNLASPVIPGGGIDPAGLANSASPVKPGRPTVVVKVELGSEDLNRTATAAQKTIGLFESLFNSLQKLFRFSS